MIKSAIVTGGFGFIGSALVEKLIASGVEVTVVENFEGSFVRNCSGRKNSAVRIIPIGINDILTDAMPELRVDAFFHFAAHYANEKSLAEPIHSVDVNVLGTMACLEYCRKMDIPEFIYASSSGVYGMKEDGMYSEKDMPNPSTPYEVGKYCGELLALGYARIYGMHVICPRFFNVYGIGDIPGRWRAVVPNFFRLALAQKVLTVTGGESSREFTYIDDVVNGILAGTELKISTAYNISWGEEVTILNLAYAIVDIVGSDSHILVDTVRKWDNAPRRYGDPTFFKELLPSAHAVHTNLMEGLQKSLDWYRETCS